MEKLKFVVKIIYDQNYLSEDEKLVYGNHGRYYRYLYFYEPVEDFKDRMAKAWKPNAYAEIFEFFSVHIASSTAQDLKGRWEPGGFLLLD
jgi:hypothetical protein